MGNYMPEQIERRANHFEKAGILDIAAMLRAYAATLRQQAGRVDEDARDAVAKAIADVIGHGMREKCYAHADAVLTALAQNTQGDGEAELFMRCKQCNGHGQAYVVVATTPGNFMDPLEDHRELDACPSCDGAGFTRALYLHAERARVLDGWVLVPREPTEEMLEATRKCVASTLVNTSIRRTIYRAMLAAAPSQRAEVK